MQQKKNPMYYFNALFGLKLLGQKLESITSIYIASIRSIYLQVFEMVFNFGTLSTVFSYSYEWLWWVHAIWHLPWTHKCTSFPRMGSLHWLIFSLNPSAFQKAKVRGYLSYSDVIMQFCPFSRLSRTIDWNGFASLTICIAQSCSSSHLFTQSLSRHITPAITVNRHYPIYLISTDWGSASLTTNMKQLFQPNHITTKNKIDQFLFFSPKTWLMMAVLAAL